MCVCGGWCIRCIWWVGVVSMSVYVGGGGGGSCVLVRM